MKLNYKSISTAVVFAVLALVLGYPNTTVIRAPVIIVAFGWMLLRNFRSFNVNRYSGTHIVWAFAFIALVSVSRLWAYQVQGIEDVNNNVIFSMLISLIVAEYVITYECTPNDIAKLLTPIAFIFFIDIAINGSISEDNRLTAGINENNFGLISAGFLIYFLYSFRKEKKHRAFNGIMSAIMTALTFFSGSRKSLIVLIIVYVSFFIFEKYTGKFVNSLIKLIGIIILIFAVYLLIMKVDRLYEIIGYRVENLITFLFRGETEDMSITSRINMLKLSWRLFTDHPMIGYGANNFKYLTYYETYSHNCYTELLSGLGIIGLALYYLPLLTFLRKAIFNWTKHCKDAIVPLCSFIIFFVADLFGVSYFSFISHAILGLAIGLTLRLFRQRILEDQAALAQEREKRNRAFRR